MIRINRIYNKENKKDKFIMDHLLPFLIRHIEEKAYAEDTVDDVAAMYIFPYKAGHGEVRLGSLKEPEVSWYFAPQGDKKCVSTGNYRILADYLIKPDHLKKLRQIFLEKKLIDDFSDDAVIKDLIGRMSRETEYTELWWTCAYDIYELWNPETVIENMADATKTMNNNSFLFIPNYSGYKFKDDLIRYNVFKDIMTSISRSAFWDKIPETEIEKARMFLKKLGVPSSFVYDRPNLIRPWMGYKQYVNPYILKFASTIGDSTAFPVDETDEAFKRCMLNHSIFMDVIYKESRQAFDEAITTEDENTYNSGIPVMNTEGEFIPLSWHLFYSNKEIEDTEDVDTSDDEEEEKTIDYHEKNLAFEYLHVDATLYDPDFIRNYENIHEFSEIYETADEYCIDEDRAVDFYKWVWGYSQHDELIGNILFHYSGYDNRRVTIDRKDNSFVMYVISSFKGEEEGYCFDINMTATEAFSFSDTVNKIDSALKGIYVVVSGNYSHIDIRDYLNLVLDAADTDFSQKGVIESDEIWNHVYLINGETGLFDDTYVKCKLCQNDHSKHYEDAIILWRSEDENSYVRALADYVHTYYGIEVQIADSFDWGKEYLDLANGIRDFISERTERKSVEDLESFVAKMDDVETFGREKRIWDFLKNQKERIMQHKKVSDPINLKHWRQFLASTYKGRCQLCGGQTITGEQNAHFYTYRLVKESQNSLANMYSNMFCLCPSCWGQMGKGDFMGKDMSELLIKTRDYVKYLENNLQTGEMEEHFPSLVKEVWEEQEFSEEEEKKLEGFHNPIVCKVMVNGKDCLMAFSWEHFMRIAFILSDAEENEEQSYGAKV